VILDLEAAAGNGSSLASDLERCYPDLCRYARNFETPLIDAQDLAHSTVCHAHARLHQLRDPAKLRQWLFRTLQRQFLQQRRRHVRHPWQPLSESEWELPRAQPAGELASDAAQVRGAGCALPHPAGHALLRRSLVPGNCRRAFPAGGDGHVTAFAREKLAARGPASPEKSAAATSTHRAAEHIFWSRTSTHHSMISTIESELTQGCPASEDFPGEPARFSREPASAVDEAQRAGADRVRGAAVEILLQGEQLLRRITAEEYARCSPAAFNASIGGHYRHCLDHFTAIARGARHGEIDYDGRDRDRRIETDPEFALEISQGLRASLREWRSAELARPVLVRCEVSYAQGNSPVTGSTVARELAYSVAHAIHHYALIAVMARIMDIELPPHFGIAPSTLQHLAQAHSA